MLKFSVSAINNYIKSILSNDINLKKIILEGEVCAFKSPSSAGHLYFELKDENARIRCVFFDVYSFYDELPFKEGDEVRLKGHVDVHEKTGSYQFIVNDVEVKGEGELLKRFLELKAKLKNEGIFEKNKRVIPFFPNKIGIITSDRGAAIKDVLSTIERRCPIPEILIYSVNVQGVNTVADVLNAIDYFNNVDDIEVVLLTRGGGSYEELSVFNDEAMARKLCDSKHPVISAIGHEVDFVITDFVADVRAATPTAAAELITPDINAILCKLKSNEELLNKLTAEKFNNEQRTLELLSNKLNTLSPSNVIFKNLSYIKTLKLQASYSIKNIINSYRNDLSDIKLALAENDYEKFFDKGFTVTVNAAGESIKLSEIKKGEKIYTIFKEGQLTSTVEEING